MKEKVEKVTEYIWRLPKDARKEMRVEARICGSKAIIDGAEDAAIEQLTNVACLPGVVEPVFAMPDIHWGYGLPMGAVGAFDPEEGVISAGMTGFDINCGIHMIQTNLTADDIKPKLGELMDKLFRNVPSGVGSKGRLRVSDPELDAVLRNGAKWAVENGYGVEEDLERMEENGHMEGADPSKVSDKAKKRGKPQLGTLGAGNHFLEVQKVDQVYDPEVAKAYGITGENQQAVIMLHCGSRGFGHQVASDYLEIMEEAAKKYKIWLPDKQLVCAPTSSKEGQDYFGAMKCGVNYAFCNRLTMTHWIRETFEDVFKRSWDSMEMHTIYDVCHNICKFEKHKGQDLYVHRKGSTRAFGPGSKDVPKIYREVGQPVLIAGSMGTASYILKGTKNAEEVTFGSTCHGAGRAMSRTKAIHSFWGDKVKKALQDTGKEIRATHPKVLAEEAPEAYKDVDEVIESVHRAGISLKVARMVPMGVAKG
jgi:tRNA-splicing ligase RtcB